MFKDGKSRVFEFHGYFKMKKFSMIALGLLGLVMYKSFHKVFDYHTTGYIALIFYGVIFCKSVALMWKIS